MPDFEHIAALADGRHMTRAEAAFVEEGLRAYMLRIYSLMVLGLAITGFAALGADLLAVTTSPALAKTTLDDGLMLTGFGYAIFASPLKWIVILSPLALFFVLSLRIHAMSAAVAQATFGVYAALVGLSLGSIFLVYTHASIVRVFFITAAAFAILGLWGATGRRDLSGMASFLIMGLSGTVIAVVVNLALGSSQLQMLASAAGVLVFAGLTGWDTRRLKREYLRGAIEGAADEKSALLGALSLYLDGINLFIVLLGLAGSREESVNGHFTDF